MAVSSAPSRARSNELCCLTVKKGLEAKTRYEQALLGQDLLPSGRTHTFQTHLPVPGSSQHKLQHTASPLVHICV